MAWRIAAKPVALFAAAFLFLAGCGPTILQPVTSVSEVGPDSVLVVGRLDIDPPLRPNEQQIRVGTIDPFGVGDKMRNHGFLSFSRSAETPSEKGEVVLNPRLGELYFVPVPKRTPYMVGGYIPIQYNMRMTGPRSLTVDDARIEVPGGLRYDIRAGDKAIYVGTLRLHRDEFNDVIKAYVVDEYAAASVEFKKRFGPGTELRKAIPHPQTEPRSSAR
jgi:hypothetical protein